MTNDSGPFKPIPDGAVYVYGANESYINASGTARIAREEYGAGMGRGWGLVGKSFGIPTKDWDINTLSLAEIKHYVNRFRSFAVSRPNMTFYITKIGCGLAGLREEDIRPMFLDAPANCILPYGWTWVRAKASSPAAAWPFPSGAPTGRWE